jgi:hypothetical protein
MWLYGLLAVLLLVLLWVFMKDYYSAKERFIDDTDLESYSKYDNMSLAWDMDSMKQRTPDSIPKPRPGDPKYNKFDNSDVVAQAVSRGDVIFQPAQGPGVSTTTDADLSPMVLAAPSGLPYMDDYSMYDSPTNGWIDIDQKLAIAQQHRGAINKKAIEGYVRSTRNIFQKYFTEELNTSPSEWWTDDFNGESMETDFGPDIDIF